jgi:hypothetical protein
MSADTLLKQMTENRRYNIRKAMKGTAELDGRQITKKARAQPGLQPVSTMVP